MCASNVHSTIPNSIFNMSHRGISGSSHCRAWLLLLSLVLSNSTDCLGVILVPTHQVHSDRRLRSSPSLPLSPTNQTAALASPSFHSRSDSSLASTALNGTTRSAANAISITQSSPPPPPPPPPPAAAFNASTVVPWSWSESNARATRHRAMMLWWCTIALLLSFVLAMTVQWVWDATVPWRHHHADDNSNHSNDDDHCTVVSSSSVGSVHTTVQPSVPTSLWTVLYQLINRAFHSNPATLTLSVGGSTSNTTPNTATHHHHHSK
jgi:hypothetical protein